MSERWVTNSSPLIVLAKVGLERLLSAIPDELLVPSAVADEILRGPEDDPARRYLAVCNLMPVATPLVGQVLATWDLGPGETSVLALASASPGTIAVIDDAGARRCAATLGIPTRGTLSVVVQAKRLGLICAAAPVVEQLQVAGLYMSDALVRDFLRQAGE